MPDQVSEAQKVIAEKQAFIRDQQRTRVTNDQLAALIKDIETRPKGSVVTVRVQDPATGRERIFGVPEEMTDALIEKLHELGEGPEPHAV